MPATITTTRPAPPPQSGSGPGPIRSLRARWRMFMILAMNALILAVAGSAVSISILEQRGAIIRLDESVTRQLNAALDRSMTGLQQTLVYAGDNQTGAALDGRLAADPALRAITIVSADGREIVHAPADPARTPPDWTQDPAYLALTGGDRPSYRALVGENPPSLTLAVKSGDAIVIAQADAQQLWGEMLSAGVGENGYIYLVSDEGAVLASGVDRADPRDPRTFAVFKDSRGGGAVMRLYRGLKGEWVVGRAQPFPGSGYTVIVETPLSDYGPLVVRTLALIALALIVTAVAGEWLIRRILRTIVAPLERLQDGARAVIAGDYRYRVRVPPHTDRELIALSDTFNRMIDRLAESQRQIDAYTNEMQEIIDLRARELARKAGQLEIAFEVSTTVGAILEPRTLIETIARLIRERFRLYHVEILLVDQESGRITSGDTRRQTTLPDLTLRDAVNSVIAWVARSGESLYVADVTIERRYLRTPDLPASQSELAIPLKSENQTIGVLNLEADHRDAFTKDDIAVLTGLAKMIAVAVHNAQTFKALQDANRDLAQATLQANQANHLKSRFLYNVSQRFRAALSPIISSAETLPPDPASERLHRILENGRVLQALVEDMIDLSAIEAGHMQLDRQWIKLTPLLEEVMNAGRALHKATYPDHDLTLKLDLMHLTEPLPPVWVDLERLRYILMNLVSNAIKFTESGEVVLSADFDRDSVYIHVRDTGPGIGDDDRRYLFDPFQHPRSQPESGAKGTGLGLPVSRLLAMRHGGDLTVETTLREGSIFTLNLPRRPEGAPPPPEA
jgi:signal transduction histidine kinase